MGHRSLGGHVLLLSSRMLKSVLETTPAFLLGVQVQAMPEFRALEVERNGPMSAPVKPLESIAYLANFRAAMSLVDDDLRRFDVGFMFASRCFLSAPNLDGTTAKSPPTICGPQE